MPILAPPGSRYGKIVIMNAQLWGDRADAAEAAVVARHLRRVWALPFTKLGVVAYPAVPKERIAWLPWHYWWQAHLIDCAIDAAERDVTPRRLKRVEKLIRSHRLRNTTGWTNTFYDDMAWLGLALERAERNLLIDHRGPIATLQAELYDSWAPEQGGGIPWCKGSDFYNTPANGPAGIMLARTGKIWRAQEMADWIDATLRDPESGLIFDGIRPARTERKMERTFYTYCQGVTLGLETELAVQVGDPRHSARVHALVDAVERGMTTGGVIFGVGGGDGGLFSGILARYLAFVATTLPGDAPLDRAARAKAAAIVTTSATAAWDNKHDHEGLPVFGPDWSVPAQVPGVGDAIARFTDGAVGSSSIPERDFSVQLSGWMVLEAAARLERTTTAT